MTDPAVQPWSQEQVERLASDFMGWKRWKAGDDLAGTYYLFDGVPWLYLSESGDGEPFSPFTDANADYRVLQRARETWGHPHAPTVDTARWHYFAALLLGAWEHAADGPEPAHVPPTRYRVGDYARAVLAVLDSQETSL